RPGCLRQPGLAHLLEITAGTVKAGADTATFAPFVPLSAAASGTPKPEWERTWAARDGGTGNETSSRGRFSHESCRIILTNLRRSVHVCLNVHHERASDGLTQPYGYGI